MVELDVNTASPITIVTGRS